MVTSKKQKLKKRILNALNSLNEKELSRDKGRYVSTKSKLTRKDKKHSGRYTPKLSIKGKYSEIIADAEEPNEEYDEWSSYRDGFRDETKIKNPDIFQDEEYKERIRKRNDKIKKQLGRQKAGKDKEL